VVCNIFVGIGNFQGFVKVLFYAIFCYWRKRLSSYFGGFVFMVGLVFPLEFMKLTRLQNINLCVKYVLMIHL